MSLGPVMLDLQGTQVSHEEQEMLMHPATGGIILFSRNFASVNQLLELVEQIKSVRDPELLIAVDQEGGRVQRLKKGFVSLPNVRRLGEIYDLDTHRACRLAETSGWLMASEVLSTGIDFSFAPVLDLDYGVSAVIGDRAFHSDPQAVARLASHYIKGMARAGMAATGKHFPGHGAVTEDSHHELPVDGRLIRDIRLRDLVPFQQIIREGLAGIMPAHVIYSRVDAQPAGFSSIWLQKILRTELAFDGVIFSDDLSMSAAKVAGGYAARASKAIDAGCDMVLVCNNPKGAWEVLQHLDGYENAQSRMRLSKMYGRCPCGYDALRNSSAWQQAAADVRGYASDRVQRA